MRLILFFAFNHRKKNEIKCKVLEMKKNNTKDIITGKNWDNDFETKMWIYINCCLS